jgi:5-formyltetrahydrofolate cyclo-ligase
MEKPTLRKIYKERRANFTSDEIEVQSMMIANQISSLELDGLGSVFLAIERFQEIETKFIKGAVENAQFAAPKMEGLELRHFLLNKNMVLETNFWGIPEPISGDEVFSENFDFVIVPLLAYDTIGNRVGYGKGIYDRFLAKCSKDCQFIGVSYFEPEAEMIETIDADIQLDMVVTPINIHRFE